MSGESKGLRLGHANWWNLAAGFLCSVIVVGSTIYSFGLYVKPFVETYGLGRAEANLGMVVLLTATAVWSPLIGSLIDRLRAEWVVCAGGVMLGLGLCGIAHAPSLGWVCVAIGGPLALGMSCAGPLAAATVAARWFRRRRGRALGIVAVSTSAGGFVMTQVGAFLILHYGWQQALTLTGIGGGLAICTFALLVIRSHPTPEQLRASGEVGPEGDPDTAVGGPGKWSTGALLRTPNFWLIAFGAGLLLASDGAILISKVPYLSDLGIGLQAASFLVACQAGSAVAGKLVVGFATERFDMRKLFAGVAFAHILMLATLLAKPSYWTLLVVFSCVGVAVGGVNPIFKALIAAAFGSRSYGAVFGRMNLVTHPINVGFTYYIGLAHDRTGSYDEAFWFFGGVVFVAAWLIALVRLPASEAHQAPDPVERVAALSQKA